MGTPQWNIATHLRVAQRLREQWGDSDSYRDAWRGYLAHELALYGYRAPDGASLTAPTATELPVAARRPESTADAIWVVPLESAPAVAVALELGRQIAANPQAAGFSFVAGATVGSTCPTPTWATGVRAAWLFDAAWGDDVGELARKATELASAEY